MRWFPRGYFRTKEGERRTRSGFLWLPRVDGKELEPRWLSRQTWMEKYIWLWGGAP